MPPVSSVDITAACQASDTEGLDGVVTVTLVDAVATFEDLADGEHVLTVADGEAAYAIDALVSCDDEAGTVAFTVTGVGAPPVPEAEVAAVTVAAREAVSPLLPANVLPATGLADGLLLGVGMALVVTGAALARLARRAA
jgi:hypothetical protein